MTNSFRNRKLSASRRSALTSPAVVESLEQKLLLTTPEIISPTGTVSGASAVDGVERQVEVSWNAVDNAESYDIWISSLNSFEQILLLEDVVGVSTSVSISDLAQGGNRVWARANLEGGGTSAWSTGADFQVDLTASLTGPTGTTGQNLIEDTTPVITWIASAEQNGFQLWVTDLNSGEIRRYNAPNILVDADGEPVLDDEGNEIFAEVRSFEIPEELPIGAYRVWVRGINIGGTPGAWSQPRDFQLGTRPVDLAPGYETAIATPDGGSITHQPTFGLTPRLTWDAVPGATNYEVWVSTDPESGARQRLDFGDAEDANGRIITTGTAFRIPQPLAGGDHVFWVRALVQSENGPTVVGAWSDPSRFTTVTAPVVLSPVGEGGVVTDFTPTITWNQIHSAAAYEVLVHRQNSPPPFLQQIVNTTSLTIDTGVAEGSYTVWVRAIGVDGTFTSYSQPLFFEATGGRPVVEVNQSPEDPFFPEITWLGFEEATSYDIFVSFLGVDFDFITQSVTATVGDSGVVATSFVSEMPLSEGEYRVWVRGVLPTTGVTPWSRPVDFTIASVDQQDDAEGQPLIQLATLEAFDELASEQLPLDETGRDVPPADGPEISVQIAQADSANDDVESTQRTSADASLSTDLLENLAENCVDAEWWEVPKQA
ncbi:MAG: hypothetical protein ABJZ55_18650 [Fuerstiella sp.]